MEKIKRSVSKVLLEASRKLREDITLEELSEIQQDISKVSILLRATILRTASDDYRDMAENLKKRRKPVRQ